MSTLKIKCSYKCCRKELDGPYGTPGVALSRSDSKTLICTSCGIREAFMGKDLPVGKFLTDLSICNLPVQETGK
ncbi:MAG: hypothetical protein ACRD33_00165 [Candidatus Acidiferrales bacterium]